MSSALFASCPHGAMPSQQLPVPAACGRGPNHNLPFAPNHHTSPSPEIFNFPSDDDTNSLDKDISAPPVLVSPIKCRQRAAAPGINKQSDLKVWGLSDEDIIGESLAF